MKYLLPKELGGGEVERYMGDDDDPMWIVRVPGSDVRLEISCEHLTPVAPPTPEEPPPGAYLIGEHLCVHAASDDEDDHWFVDREGTAWFSWPELWERFGGPDVTIRPLRPAPEPVELPWRQNFNDGDPLIVDRSSASNRDVYVSGFAHLAAEDARSFAYAILTAAGDQ